MSDTAIKIENLKKQYHLGAIGGATLRGELQSWWARKQGKEDPNLRIDQSYGERNETFWALDGINLEVKKGEALGIIGTNGAGKSTLLKILSRVTAPTEGDIWINGRIASMLEVGTGFHGELTGRENVYMNGAILGMSRKEVDEKMESIIEFSECRQFIDTPVKRYSSGMYVKLAFSVASHLDSDILIMDEVLAVGDMAFQKKCLGRMEEAAEGEGRTVLYVSHNMTTIRTLCNRCIVLDKGHLIYDGTPEKAIEIYSNHNMGDYTQTHYEFDGMARRDNLGNLEYIHSFDFLHDSAAFSSDELIKFKVEWTGQVRRDNLHFRIAIRQADSTNVGMGETTILQKAVEAGNHSITGCFDPSMLTEGNYVMVISLNLIDRTSRSEMRDEAPVLIPFSISENLHLREERSRWIRKYWGSVRFPDIQIIEET